jgi:uncharacterized protein
MRDIAWRVEAGHRLRLTIAGSDFPRLERNLHTGDHRPSQTRSQAAEHSVHHGGATLAAVALHVLPEDQP